MDGQDDCNIAPSLRVGYNKRGGTTLHRNIIIEQHESHEINGGELTTGRNDFIFDM
jgi:hypothetical protein